MWFQRAEGAKFWLAVLTELRQRGLQDVLVCCVDGLTGFPEAIEAVYPKAWVQTCLVHQVRASLRFVPYRDKKKVAADLKKIYSAVDRDHAEAELERFAATWDQRYPMISASWLEHWERIVPVLSFPPDVRRAIYHDQHDRGAQPPNPQGHQDARQLPHRGLSPQADLPRHHPRTDQVGDAPTTGTAPWSPSRSTSASACPTPQSDHRPLTSRESRLQSTTSAYTESRTP